MLPATLAGFLTGLSLIVAIGAQNAFVLRQGLRREHVLPVVLVCAGADALLVSVGVAGLGSLVADRPVVLQVVRWAGAAFLAVLAVGAARRALRPEHLDPAADGPARRSAVVLTCLALTFLNPHVYLDTVVLLGGLAQQHPAAGGWAFGAGAVVASITWFTTLGFGAARLRPLFARPRAWQVLDVGVALVMAGLAVSLVVG
ncbi:LysE/ArgO family amino acid transporter [Cellulomonas fimi]|uniref:Lysine exporter protein (LYSE/YGGA) n=1 Tax=Cellulomonas fimi (strain ATCC 484 / DSM 20113 / JCM 1341 / CCUG 24087 / LMG 16345 / NBRC 15513 / NCIMB 8980 / NCTC 7547 / NRS-133) TaxID=590998 RepID=F4H205_CELFA|nr:LysE/ArgO family amino acid transporter [Cellulomonas fimi]AEE45175.1 Lysine exporter protein (LYSE/YGGA) [Cellulomonas fimi ATCC 484]NNH06262.1 amino acid transporter [Cellulomonas fimi]VEH28468.1 Arginine exporter protein ArgO [Cellulomonas fimi]